MSKHILSILVENRAGVLSKVVGLFSRRSFNIDSLAVGETHDPAYSRITICAQGDDSTVEQMIKQLQKLIAVVTVRHVSTSEFVSRELLLVKVKADAQTRPGIIQIVDIFRANIVDVSKDALTIEVSAQQEKIAALLDILSDFGILELARTGIVALERGQKNIYDNTIERKRY